MTAKRGIVCVQGLGFVGAAMATAVAQATDGEGRCFEVIGLDRDTPDGRDRVAAINEGRFPFATADEELAKATAAAVREAGNLSATTDPAVLARADIVVVSIGLDLDRSVAPPQVDLKGLRAAVATIGAHLRPDALVIVETTVPPGTCERVIAPLLAECLQARGLPGDAFLLAHAYERVMPGREYLHSIVNFWRCYAGHTDAAADACGAFLSRIINVADYPLTRLSSTRASETAKVLENSYRSVTIALMEEWGRFAEAIDIDLFEVVDAIRVRPTHSNMRTPGFGVGGYCLTKDPLFADVAARELFDRGDLQFPFCTQAVAINERMPLVSVERVASMLGGLEGRRLLLLGVSYRPDVGDTRYSPSESFVRAVRAQGGTVLVHDPIVRYWPELDLEVGEEVPSPEGVDAVVLGVPHRAYLAMDMLAWLDGRRPVVFDAAGVLSAAQRRALVGAGVRLGSIGRGDGQ